MIVDGDVLLPVHERVALVDLEAGGTVLCLDLLALLRVDDAALPPLVERTGLVLLQHAAVDGQSTIYLIS